MKKITILTLLLALFLVACNNGTNNPNEPDAGGNTPNDPSSVVTPLKIIEVDYFGTAKQTDNHYESMRFASSNVGYVTNPDSSISVSGSGAILDILLVASSVDDNNVPVAGTYLVGEYDSDYTALCEKRKLNNITVLPALYEVSDGEVSDAISYSDGSVVLSVTGSIYKISISLTCEDGTQRLFEFNGSLTVIDKSEEEGGGDDTGITAISFIQEGPILLTEGMTTTLNIQFQPSNLSDNVVFEVDNPNVASISNTANASCEIVANSEGNCTVTARCVHYNASATIRIQVYSTSDNDYTFDYIYWMAEDDEMGGDRYAIYRLRQYRGDEIEDDAALTRDNDSSKRLPDDGTWLYRYTDSDGSLWGIFKDSVLSFRTWLLSQNAYFDSNSNFVVSDFAPIMAFESVINFDSKYYYCLGDYDIVYDATAGDTLRPSGVAPRPMPSCIQKSRFSQNNYLTWASDVINGGSVTFSDYNIFGDGDARFYAFYYYNTSGEDVLASRFLGTVNSGTISISATGTGSIFADSYTINATIYDNPTSYCLAMHNDGNGNMVYDTPYAMASSTNKTYIKVSQNAPRHSQAMPLLKSSMRKQMKVNSTIGATLKLYLHTPRKIWRHR